MEEDVTLYVIKSITKHTICDLTCILNVLKIYSSLNGKNVINTFFPAEEEHS